MEDEEVHLNDEGVPQGGSISVLLSNLYLHYVLDVWFEQIVRPWLRSEAKRIWCAIWMTLWCASNIEKMQSDSKMYCKRLKKFSLALECELRAKNTQS